MLVCLVAVFEVGIYLLLEGSLSNAFVSKQRLYLPACHNVIIDIDFSQRATHVVSHLDVFLAKARAKAWQSGGGGRGFIQHIPRVKVQVHAVQ